MFLGMCVHCCGYDDDYNDGCSDAPCVEELGAHDVECDGCDDDDDECVLHAYELEL